MARNPSRRGVTPMLTDDHPSYDATIGLGRRAVAERALVSPGDRTVITAGARINQAGGTNLLVIETL